MPKKPCILDSCTPPNFITIPAAINWPINFLLADKTRISSLRPKKKITVAAAAKYCNSEPIPEGTPINVAIINPAKMPRPPKVGITVL